MADKQDVEVPFLSNVGMMLTYKCTIACPHCIVEAGPRRKEEMKITSAFEWLDQLRDFRDGWVIGISLTGGEPFYNMDHLIRIADYAFKLGFIVSVVSNAFWASSREEALRVLKLCSSINMISVSTDKSHQISIPFRNISNAVWAAKKLGKLYNIAVATESDKDPEYLSLLDNILEITDRENISTSYILPVGRAGRNLKIRECNLSPVPPPYACPMASFPVIFPNSKVIACIGPPITMPSFTPLFLGNLGKETVQEIFMRAESNYILHAIRTFGPRILIDLLTEHGHSDILPDKYMNEAICDICFKLFSNESTCQLLNELIMKDETFRNKIAWGRYYHMNESEMVGQSSIPDPVR